MLCKTKLIYHFWKLNRRQFLACQVSAKPRTYEAETGAGCVIGILTMGLLSLFNWVGFHPLYTLNNQFFFHCSNVIFFLGGEGHKNFIKKTKGQKVKTVMAFCNPLTN